MPEHGSPEISAARAKQQTRLRRVSGPGLLPASGLGGGARGAAVAYARSCQRAARRGPGQLLASGLRGGQRPAAPPSSTADLPLQVGLREQERQRIDEALAATASRVSGAHGAAVRLGVPASTLDSRIKNWGQAAFLVVARNVTLEHGLA